MTMEHPPRINLTGLQEGMASAGLDVLIAASLENFCYVTSVWLLSQSIIPARLCFAVLVQNQPPGIVACYCEEQQLQAESWIADIRTYLEHHESPLDILAQYLQERGLGTARIGLEQRFLASGYVSELATALPDATLADADPILDAARAIKTPAEQAVLHQSARVTEEAILSTFQAAQPGDTEKEMADALAARVLRAGATSFWITLSTGSNTAINHPPPSDKPLTTGEILRVDVGGLFDGYQSDVARTAAIGKASAEQQSVYKRLWEAERETIAAIQPGVRACDIYTAGQQALAQRGLTITSQAIGHSLGIGMHEFPLIHGRSEAELAPGMVLSIEPAVKDSQGFLYHLEDLVLVTENGHRILTTLMDTEELFVIGTD